MALHFRPVEPRDHAVTREIVDAAFTPEDVAGFLDALRAAGCLIGEWLAEDESGVVGHIGFSRAHLERSDGERLPAAFLTPLGVRPERQRQGVGLALMRHALDRLEQGGENLYFVIGHATYYPKVGFRTVAFDEVASPWTGSPAFMMRCAFAPRGRLLAPPVIRDAH
ncbi:GNAT family N-acetyltransferase [Methylocystis bryophila]|nr:N-acetyltransferase [Methylocystis bryophila]